MMVDELLVILPINSIKPACLAVWKPLKLKHQARSEMQTASYGHLA